MRGVPNVLFLELTRRCNLACSMCRGSMMTDHSLDMSEAVLRRIEEDLLPTARVVDLRGWGESLVRRDFLSIVERFTFYLPPRNMKTVSKKSSARIASDEPTTVRVVAVDTPSAVGVAT